jgi:hypothetical protein
MTAERQSKKNGEKRSCFFTRHFFNQIAAFNSYARSVEVKSTYRLLLRCCCHLLALITAELQSKKNGEKTPSFDVVTVLLHTIFSINLLLLIRTPDLWY